MRILAGRIVRRHQEHLLHAGVLRVFAHHLVVLVVLIGGDEEVRVAILAGEVRGAGVRADQEGAALGHRLHDGDQDVGEDRADDEVDLVAVDQRLGLADGDVGLEFVVLDEQLDLAAAELAAHVLDRELEAVAELLAEHGRRARQRGDDADFQLVLRAGCGRRKGTDRGGRDESGIRLAFSMASPVSGNVLYLSAGFARSRARPFGGSAFVESIKAGRYRARRDCRH